MCKIFGGKYYSITWRNRIMKIIFLGIKNIKFFSEELLNKFEKVFLLSEGDTQIIKTMTGDQVFYVSEKLDHDLKTKKLNFEECISILKNIITFKDDVKIFCNQESNLRVAEKIRLHFGIYDHMYGKTSIFLDKVKMKKTLSNTEIKTPKYLDFDINIENIIFDELKSHLGNVFIIKPKSSVGSRGIHVIKSEVDFLRFKDITFNDKCKYHAEEFIDGKLYQFDVVIQNHEIIYHNVSRYSCPMMELQNGETLSSIMLDRKDEMHTRISNFGKKCIAKFQVKHGCFHMEIFHSIDDELIFLEVAARSPGLMTVPAYYSWEGVNMYDLELLLQCKMKIDKGKLITSITPKPAFFVVYPKRNGLVKCTNSPKTEDDIEESWKVKEGEVINATTTNIDYAAIFFVKCNSVERVMDAYEFFTFKFEAITVIPS